MDILLMKEITQLEFCNNIQNWTEQPEFVNLSRSSGIDSKFLIYYTKQCCGSETGSRSCLNVVLDSDPDSNPDPNPGFRSRSETGQKSSFIVLEFATSLIFKHKRPFHSSVTLLPRRCAINLQDSDSDLLVSGTDPPIRIRTKKTKSRIHNNAFNYLLMFSTVQRLLTLLVIEKYILSYVCCGGYFLLPHRE